MLAIAIIAIITNVKGDPLTLPGSTGIVRGYLSTDFYYRAISKVWGTDSTSYLKFLVSQTV